MLQENTYPEFVQGSPEWLESRNNYIGASELSTIMGYNEYKTPYELWKQKLGLAPPDKETPAMKRGKLLEPEALKYLEAMENIQVIDQPVLIHKEYDFIRVSLDGISKCGRYIVEAKSPMSENSKTHDQASFGKACPLVHYCQVQMCIEVARQYYPNLKGAFYISYMHDNPENSVICEVLPDDKFIKRLIKCACEFWDLIQTQTPPPMQEKEYENIELDEKSFLWQSLISKYLENNNLKKKILEEEQYLREEIIKLSDKKNIEGFGIKLNHSSRKGAVNYKKIPELRHVDLDLYRGEPTLVSTLKVC